MKRGKNIAIGGSITDITHNNVFNIPFIIMSCMISGVLILNKNLDVSAKILPDMSVVSGADKSTYMPVEGKASSATLAIAYDGT